MQELKSLNIQSLSIRIVLQDDKTLVEDQIKSTMDAIIDLMSKRFEAKLR